MSLSSTFCTNEELITLDLERGREATRHILNGLLESAIMPHAIHRDLKIYSGARSLAVLRNAEILRNKRSSLGP